MAGYLPPRGALLRLLLVGAALGLVVLGGGGRAAMRVVALQTRPAPAFSPGGTFTVLMAGAGSGALGAALLLLAHGLAAAAGARRAWARHLLFAALLLWVALRGLHPVDPLAASLFLPLVALYALLLARLARPYLPAAERPAAAPPHPA